MNKYGHGELHKTRYYSCEIRKKLIEDLQIYFAILSRSSNLSPQSCLMVWRRNGLRKEDWGRCRRSGSNHSQKPSRIGVKGKKVNSPSILQMTYETNLQYAAYVGLTLFHNIFPRMGTHIDNTRHRTMCGFLFHSGTTTSCLTFLAYECITSKERYGARGRVCTYVFQLRNANSPGVQKFVMNERVCERGYHT